MIEPKIMRMHEINYTQEQINIDTHIIDTKTALCTKHSGWAYENEVRLVDYQPAAAEPFRAIPLDKGACIESVYFGYRCSDKCMETIKRILSGRPGVKFFKMESRPDDIYRLEVKEI